MGTTQRVLSGSKTKGSFASLTSSVRPFLQGINASSDEDYFGTSLTPRAGSGPRFALFRGRNRISDLHYDDTLRASDSKASIKVSHATASITFTGQPSFYVPGDFDTSMGISIKSADGQLEGVFLPVNVATPSTPEFFDQSEFPGIFKTTFQASSDRSGSADNFRRAINNSFGGRITATTGALRPASLNSTVFLRQSIAGPTGKTAILLGAQQNIQITGSTLITASLTAGLQGTNFGFAKELSVDFLSKDPVKKRVNFQRKQLNFGQPPTSPEKQPYHEVNTFNPVSFIEADERSMWPVNLFNAGNIPDRVFDGVIEPLDIRSLLLQMHDPRYVGHQVRGDVVGSFASSLLGAKEIQHSTNPNDPPPPPYLDAPLGFNAGAVDIQSGVTFLSGGINGQKKVLAPGQKTLQAQQPFSNIDVQPTNPFFERNVSEIVNDTLTFNNPLEVARLKAKAGFKAFSSLDFSDAYFFPSTGSAFSDANACQLILTSSDGTIRVFTGSENPTAANPGSNVRAFQVEVPKPASLLIVQGTSVPADTTNSGEAVRIGGLSQGQLTAGSDVTDGNVLKGTLKSSFAAYLVFDSTLTPMSRATGWDWNRSITPSVLSPANWTTYEAAWIVGTSGLTTPAQVSQAIVDTINDPTRRSQHHPLVTASLYSAGTFTGIKVSSIIAGDVGNSFSMTVGSVFGGAFDNPASGWKITTWEPHDLELDAIGIPADATLRATLSGSGTEGTRSMGAIRFRSEIVGTSHGETFTIVTTNNKGTRVIPTSYVSSSVFTFDSTIPPEQGGAFGNKFKVGIFGLTEDPEFGPGVAPNATRRAAVIHSQSKAIAISVYNSLGHAIEIGRVSRFDVGHTAKERTFPYITFMQPFSGEFANTTINPDPTNYTATSSWRTLNFVSGSLSSTSRAFALKSLSSSIDHAFFSSGKGKLLNERGSTVFFPDTTLKLTQTKGGPASNTAVSSSIYRLKINPSVQGGASRQYGVFRGPPTAKKSSLVSILDKNNPTDGGNLDPKTENANHGFYFDKKAGSIVYGDE